MRTLNLLLATLALPLITATLHAEVSLLSLEDTDGLQKVTLRFEPRADATEAERAESALLGGEWKDATTTSPDIELESVRVGSYAGLRVIRREGDGPATVIVTGHVEGSRKSSQVDPRWSRLFLTPPEVATDNSGTKAIAPVVPGTDRLTIADGGGLCRVAPAFLGVSPSALADVAFVHAGNLLPVVIESGGDAIVYTPAASSLTNVTDSIFITRDATTPSAAMPTRPAFPTLSPAGTEQSVARSLTHAPNLVYDRSSFAPLGERFLIHGASPSQTRTVSIPFTDKLTSTTMTLTAELHGRTVSTANPDHFANFTLNGIAAPQVTWEGRTIATGTWDLVLPSLTPATPLTITHAIPAGSPFDGGTDLQGLKSLVLRWTGLPRLTAAGQLRLEVESTAAPRLVTVGGFPAGTTAADVLIMQVSPAIERVDQPSLFTDQDGGIAVEFESPAGDRVFLVAHLPAVPAPDAIAPVAALPDPAGLSTALRTMIVRPPTLAATLAPLVAARGAGVIELDPQAAYDHFNHGQESPEALRDALAWIVASAPSTVPFPEVLLVGHASIDRKDYLGNQSGAQVPTFLELGVVQSLSIQNENPVDFPYGLLRGEDEFLDASVARLPVRTAAELSPMAARILAWEAAAPALATVDRPALFIIDEDTLFQGDAPLWESLWTSTGRTAEFLHVDPVTESGGQDGLAEKAIIKAALEAEPAGRSVVMFMGHGTSDRWSGHRILQSSDVATINTQDRWPIVATFTCLNALYASATVAPACLSESWMLPENRGAIASIAPSGVDVYGTQRLFPIVMLELLDSPAESAPQTVGEWMMMTQNEFTLRYPSVSRTARELLLFGDPASPLALGTAESSVGEGWILH